MEQFVQAFTYLVKVSRGFSVSADKDTQEILTMIVMMIIETMIMTLMVISKTKMIMTMIMIIESMMVMATMMI